MRYKKYQTAPYSRKPEYQNYCEGLDVLQNDVYGSRKERKLTNVLFFQDIDKKCKWKKTRRTGKRDRALKKQIIPTGRTDDDMMNQKV